MAGESIKLIAGLGNPGRDYSDTRHNAGFWLLDKLLIETEFKLEKKFSAQTGTCQISHQSIILVKPQTFMNRSGSSIQAISHFYKIPPESILIVHDELDLLPGKAKLKKSGGHGGHNGLRDTIAQLGSKDFYRLRIGIGHPGNKHQVSQYVLHKPSKEDSLLIDTALDHCVQILADVVNGRMDQAMNFLHAK